MEKSYNKIISGILVLSLFLLPVITAQETPTNPGITPDSFLWGIDRALEQISLLLTISPEAKATKGLEIAQERLAEIKAMIEEGDLEAAGKAEDAHGKILLKVKIKIDEIEEDDSLEEIEKVIEIEEELENHNEDVEQTFGELKIKIKIEGELTQEQMDLIDSILENLQGQTGEVEIEIEIKKNKTKIKIKIETDKSDEEIEEDIEKLEVGAGVSGIEIEAEIVGSQSEVEIEREFSTTTTDREAIIDEIIEKFALDREIADVALELEVETEEEELKEKFKVEVEIEEGIAEVKVELGKEEFEFTLETTDREIIISEIMDRTGLTREEIENVIEFEEDEEIEEEDVACAEFGGEWIEEYDECASGYADRDIEGFCTKYNGEYDECASACRHESGFGDCTDDCIAVCSL